MNANTNTFLSSYKELEDILRRRGQGFTVLKYEETLTEDNADRLRICRQIRNYIQHHEDGEEFIPCSDKMCAFLQELIKNEKEMKNQHIRRITPISSSDRLSDIKATFAKSNRTWMPVVDKHGRYVGSFDMLQLIRISSTVSPNQKLSSVMRPDDFNTTSVTVLRNEAEINAFEGADGVIVEDDERYIGVYF